MNSTNIIGTLFVALIYIFLATVIPYFIISSENHIVITGISKLRLMGIVLIILGIVGHVSCSYNFIVDAQGTPIFMDPKKRLMVKGLYGYVRNPMYISFYLVVLGEALFFQSLQMFFYLAALMVWFHCIVIFYEEKVLRYHFGGEYEKYCRSVGRWIPRLMTAHDKNENL